VRIALPAALALMTLTVSVPAVAQIKAGIMPRAKSEIAAERAARAERDHQQQRASTDDQRRADEAFARMDTNRDGRISPEEYRAAGAVQEAFEDHLGAQGQQSR
jgi:hypothetical protein